MKNNQNLNIPKELKNVGNIKYFAKGKRSFVFTANLKNKKIIIKKSRLNTESRISHEGEILKFLNKHKIGPKIFNVKNNKETDESEIWIEFIEGITIKNFLETEKNQNRKKEICKKILEQCYILDKLKINKEEMSNPYKHILLEFRRGAHNENEQPRSQMRDKSKFANKTKITMIDFERSHYTEKPKNLTQFFQYIVTNKIIERTANIEEILKDYKKDQSEKNFKRILNLLE